MSLSAIRAFYNSLVKRLTKASSTDFGLLGTFFYSTFNVEMTKKRAAFLIGKAALFNGMY